MSTARPIMIHNNTLFSEVIQCNINTANKNDKSNPKQMKKTAANLQLAPLIH